MINLTEILDQRDIQLAILKQEVVAKAISKGNKRVRRNGVTVQQLNKLNTIIKKLHKLANEVLVDQEKEAEFLVEVVSQLESFKEEQNK